MNDFELSRNIAPVFAKKKFQRQKTEWVVTSCYIDTSVRVGIIEEMKALIILNLIIGFLRGGGSKGRGFPNIP